MLSVQKPSQTTVVIRQAKLTDISKLAKLDLDGYRERTENIDFGDLMRAKRPSIEFEIGWFSKLVRDSKNGTSVLFVAQKGEEVIGYCLIRPKDWPRSEISHVGEVSLRVTQEERNRGVGTSLMEAGIRKSEEKFEKLNLSVFASNKGAKRLYKRFGFKTYGKAPGFIKRLDGKFVDDFEYMYKDL